jgi:hypothetical protein
MVIGWRLIETAKRLNHPSSVHARFKTRAGRLVCPASRAPECLASCRTILNYA